MNPLWKDKSLSRAQLPQDRLIQLWYDPFPAGCWQTVTGSMFLAITPAFPAAQPPRKELKIYVRVSSQCSYSRDEPDRAARLGHCGGGMWWLHKMGNTEGTGRDRMEQDRMGQTAGTSSADSTVSPLVHMLKLQHSTQLLRRGSLCCFCFSRG